MFSAARERDSRCFCLKRNVSESIEGVGIPWTELHLFGISSCLLLTACRPEPQRAESHTASQCVVVHTTSRKLLCLRLAHYAFYSIQPNVDLTQALLILVITWIGSV